MSNYESKLLEKNGLGVYLTRKPLGFRSSAIGVDSYENNIRLAMEEAGFSGKILYSATQVHGNVVSDITKDESIPTKFGRHFELADGLISNEKESVLMVKFADCTPIIILDPIRKVQSVAHAGWRSTVSKISKIAVEKMVQDFGCEVKDMLAYIGPTIDQSNYEVGSEVYDMFSPFRNRDKIFQRSSIPDKFYMSMKEANLEVLREVGFNDSQIECSDESTFLTPSLHSARRDGKNYEVNAIFTKFL